MKGASHVDSHCGVSGFKRAANAGSQSRSGRGEVVALLAAMQPLGQIAAGAQASIKSLRLPSAQAILPISAQKYFRVKSNRGPRTTW